MLSTALKVNGDPFDAARVNIAGNFAGNPAKIEPARQRLATAPLSIAPENNREVQVAKKGGLAETGARRARGCEPQASAVQPTRRGQGTLAKSRPLAASSA